MDTEYSITPVHDAWVRRHTPFRLCPKILPADRTSGNITVHTAGKFTVATNRAIVDWMLIDSPAPLGPGYVPGGPVAATWLQRNAACGAPHDFCFDSFGKIPNR